MKVCGWCLDFTPGCCEGRFEWCEHGGWCQMKLVTFKEAPRWCPQHGVEHRMARCEGTKEGVTMGTVLEAAWAQIDAEVDEIMENNEQDRSDEERRGAGVTFEVEKRRQSQRDRKARARGKAEVIALFMAAPWDTADAVSTEAGKRYRQRQAGEAVQPVPHKTWQDAALVGKELRA